MRPFFSIIIPAYNQGQFLNETLQSVSDQTCNDWECLIIDDGSTDNTSEIAFTWVQKDDRFKAHQKKNGGLSSARNYGLSKSAGQYIQFLDSDDLLYPQKLEQAQLKHKKGIDIVVTHYDIFEKGQRIEIKPNIQQKSLTFHKILLSWDIDFAIPIHCGSFSQSTIGDIRFNENFNAGEDWIFWLTIFKKEPQACFIPTSLVSYRLHNQGMTRNPDHMIKNKHLAQQYIYDMLDTEEEKKLFFSRFSLEVLKIREELITEQKKSDKRIAIRIRNSLRKLRKKLRLP